MKKKYLYNGQFLELADVEEAAKESNLDIYSYMQKAGIKEVDDTYGYNGQTFTAEDVLEAANQSKLGFDDYIQKAGFQAISQKKSPSQNEPQVVSGEPATTSAPSTLPSQENEIVDLRAEAAKFEAENPDNSIYDSYSPVDLAKLGDELSKKQVVSGVSGSTGGAAVNYAPDEEAIKKADKIKNYLSTKGFDIDKLNAAFTGVPERAYDITFPDGTKPFSKDRLLKQMKENPEAFNRQISVFKWQLPLLDEVRKRMAETNDPLEQETLKADETTIINSQKPSTNYKEKRIDNRYVLSLLRKYAPDSDEMQKWISNYAVDKADSYGLIADLNPDELTADQNTKYLNTNQKAAYHYLEDVGQAESYKAALIDPAKFIGDDDAETGQQEKLMRLDEIGATLRANAAKERLNEFIKVSQERPLTDEEIQQANSLQQVIEVSQRSKDSLLTDYPKAGYYEAENVAQEILGQRHSGLNWIALEAGKATEGTAKSIWDIASAPFRSDENNYIEQMRILGSSKASEQSTYLRQENVLDKTFTTVVSEELQTEIDKIKNNKTLSESEKRIQVTQRLMQNPEQWHKAPIEGGKTNIGLTSLFYGVGGLAADLAPFMVAEALTGGGATAGALRKFASVFTSAAVTSFNDVYAHAIEEGVDNPYAYAARVTAINSAALAGAGTPDAIRKMLGGTKSAIGDMASRLTDKEITAALKAEPKALSVFAQAYNIGKKVGTSTLEGAKGAGKIVPLMTAGNIVNDVLDNSVRPVGDYAKQAAIEGLKFTIFGGVGGTIGRLNQKVNDIQKATLYTAAAKPVPFLEALKQKEEAGTITPQEALQVRTNIAKATEVYKKIPFVDNAGEPLSERSRRDLMFLKLQESDIGNTLETKEVPKELQKKMQEDLKVIQEKTEAIYNERFAPKPVDEIKAGEPDLLSQAKELVNKDVVKGFSAETLKEAANNDPAAFEGYLKEISEQAADPQSRNTTIKTYGQELVDIAEKLNRKEEATPTDVVSSKGEVGLVKASDTVSGILGISEQDAEALTLIRNANHLSPVEKNMLHRQYKNGVMSLKDLQNYTAVDIGKINEGEEGKWARAVLKTVADKNKSNISAEDIYFEELPQPTSSSKGVEGEKVNEITPDDVKVRKAKGDRGEFDGVNEVVYNGEVIGEMYFDRSMHNGWLDADAKAGLEFSDVLGYNKAEAVKEVVDRFNIKNKTVSSESKNISNEQGTQPLKVNSEQVQYNGQDVIGSRSRPQSEKDAGQASAKTKIKEPSTNASLKTANEYNTSVGLPEVTSHKYKPSDKELQGKIAELYPKLQDVNSPSYKETDVERQIFKQYKEKYPSIISDFDIKDYRDLVKKSYGQLIKEVEGQYEVLPVKVTFHEGDKNYESSAEMLDDVHNFNHLWVYKGGDDHTELGSQTRDKNGLTANDKFRAVHDYFGHSVEGFQFGKDGEENAWIEHSKMFSPLAQWALSSETRGQNSFVNFSGVNEVPLEKLKLGSALKKEGRKQNNEEMITEGQKLIDEANGEFNYAEQKAMLLPPTDTDISNYHTSVIKDVPEKLKPTKTKPVQKSDLGTKARELAKQLREGEKNILPEWLRANLPKDTKIQGIDINSAFAKALETFADIHDATKDFAKAVEGGFKHIKDWFDDNKIPYDEKQLRENFLNEVKNEPPKPPSSASSEATFEGGGREKALLNRLVNAKKVPDNVKAAFVREGLDYKPKSQKEAEKIADYVIDEAGIDDAVLMAQAQKFGGDVNSFIQTQALNKLAELSEQDGLTGNKQSQFANDLKFAQVAISLDKWVRDKAGRGIAALNRFYKKSPLGVVMYENMKRGKEFSGWAKAKEESWKDFYDRMMKEPEFAEVVKTEADNTLKIERAEARKERKERVHKYIDDSLSKWANALKAKGAEGAAKQGVGVDEIFKAVGATMKAAYDAGEAVAKIVQDAVDYISKNLGYDEWDKAGFTKEWTDRLGRTSEPVDFAERYKASLRNQIGKLDEQIQNRQKNVREKKTKEYDDETKSLIVERDSKRQQLNEITSDKTKKVLDKFRNKLSGLSDKQKEDVIKKSYKEIIENGGLEYEEFRKIIADVAGYGELTKAEADRMKELVKKTNAVEAAADNYRELRTKEAKIAYRAAQLEAGAAQRELNELVNNSPDIIKRLTSIMQLNTLGIPSLINNPIYNVFNQLTVRLPVGLTNDLIDRGIGLAAKVTGKNYEREFNILETQKDFFEGLGFGAKESISQVLSGLNRQDYIQKEIQEQAIRPHTALKDLIAFAKGNKNLNKKQVWDKALQATVGVPAEAVARILNIGDKPQRFAAESAQAAAFAKALGLKGMDYELFLEFPREEAYRAYREKGLSEAEASLKADYIKDAIIQEGKRSTFQQDNLLNDAINLAFGLFGSKKQGLANLTKAVTISPFIKIPSNAFWSFFNIVNPEVALLQAFAHGGRAYALRNEGGNSARLQLREGRYWIAHAVTGMALRAVITPLVAAGIFNTANTGDDSKREREGEQNYEPQGTINLTKLNALLRGKDPTKVKGGVVVQNRWFGIMGTAGNAIARRYEEMTPEQKEKQQEFFNIMFGGLEQDGLKDLQQGVFGNTSALLSAIDNNGSYGFKQYGLNTLNMFSNVVQPAALAQFSRAELPYYSTPRADNFLEELNNSLLQRSSIVRALENRYPPAKISIWGEPMKREGNTIERLFGITPTNKDNFAQPIYNDAKRLNDITFFPPAVPNKLNGKELNTKQHRLLQEYIGQARKSNVAPYINDEATVSGYDGVYSELSDKDRKEALEYLYKLGRQEGIEKFLEDYPEFEKVPEEE